MTNQGKKREAKRKQRERRVKQEKHQRRLLHVQRAKSTPQPAPTGLGFFVQQFLRLRSGQVWDKLGLDKALEKVGIVKDGLPFSAIFIIVLLMGIMNATSLHNLIDIVPQDAVLMAMLALESLEEKQLYRGLARISIAQYQAWMSELLKSLQADPRTASLSSGVVIADTTQVLKRFSHKIPGVHILFVHSEKVFAKGVDRFGCAHYKDNQHPLCGWEQGLPLICGLLSVLRLRSGQALMKRFWPNGRPKRRNIRPGWMAGSRPRCWLTSKRKQPGGTNRNWSR